MSSNDHDDPLATRSASPSSAEPAGATAPHLASRSHQRPSAAAQLRDPDRYQIINEHGRGGLGRVSRAHDRDLGRDVAIKELISRGNLSEVRFLREALITARLEHPGIVPVHEAGRWPDGTPFYAMKLVAGRPLRDLIAERTTVTERIGLLHHVIAVADALAYAHGRNIIHRDLKPANVIVGDFGETIVIDWGLAKDLSTTEDAATDGGPFRAHHDANLTSTGSVLGTPAYMAPEQERGEHVDQRADVFAIGAMLWELCSLQKVPPSDQGLRHRMLRRAGIDRDLVTIIDKALAPDAGERYPNAGALAADLKAFKSGSRIAARSYSLIALLMHWTRRHRSLAISLCAAVAVSVAAIALYIHDTNAERYRAEIARSAADLATESAKAALAEQTLGHAEVLLSSDPSATVDLLDSYQGMDRFRQDILRAKANGIGVARMRATPHTDEVYWAHELRGGRIATLSADGSVAVTGTTGAVTIIEHGANNRDTWSFSEARQLLAYVCDENEICILDFSNTIPTISFRLAALGPEGLAFSPDSRTLISVSRTSDLLGWDITRPDKPSKIFTSSARGFNVGFLGDDAMIAVDRTTATIATRSGLLGTIALDGATNTARSPDSSAFAIGTEQGIAILADHSSASGQHRAHLCDSPVQALRFAAGHNVIAYGCKDGKVGLWKADISEVEALTTIAGTAGELATSSDGRYIAVGGTAGVISLVDVTTRIVTQRLGHGGRISAISSLDHAGALFATTDVNGTLRTWSRPPSISHIAYRASARLYDLQFLGDSAIVTTGVDPALHFFKYGTVREATPHDPGNDHLALAPDGEHFASFGSQNKIELWDGVREHLIGTISTHNSEVVQLKFTSLDTIIYATNSGELTLWSPGSGPVNIFTFPQAISTFTIVPTNTIVVELHDGTLYRIPPQSAPVPISQTHPHEHIIRVSEDRQWLATGNDDGETSVYDTKDWRRTLQFKGSGPTRYIAMAPANDMLAILMKSGALHIGRVSKDATVPSWHISQWEHLLTHAQFATFTPDGDLLIITTADGFVWFHSRSHHTWFYFYTGAAGTSLLRSSPDGRHAAATDSTGRLSIIDLDIVRSIVSSLSITLPSYLNTQERHK